jgi:hypothetical protein
MPEPPAARKCAIAGGLLALQRAGELTVWVDADAVRIGPPAGPLVLPHDHRRWITWQQAERLVRRKAYRESFTKAWK